MSEITINLLDLAADEQKARFNKLFKLGLLRYDLKTKQFNWSNEVNQE